MTRVLNELGVPPDPLRADGPLQAAQIEHDPIVILLYTLMRRGTIVHSQLEHVIRAIREGDTPATEVADVRDKVLLDRAVELAGQLPWYRGA